MLYSQLIFISIYTLLLLIPLSTNVQGRTLTTSQKSTLPLFSSSSSNSIITTNRHLSKASAIDYDDLDDDDNDVDDGSGSSLLDKYDLLLDTCEPLTQCELCPNSMTSKKNGKGHDSGCEMTGKRIHIQCQLDNEDSSNNKSGSGEDGDMVKLYTSCSRTVMDEEYLMVSTYILSLVVHIYYILFEYFNVDGLNQSFIVSISFFSTQTSFLCSCG